VPTTLLVDTSLWIEFYRPQGDPRARQALLHALQEREVVTVAPVVAELLLGVASARQAGALLADLGALRLLPLSLPEAEAAAQLGRRLREAGRPIPTVDLLIAGAALAHGCELWHWGDEHYRRAHQAGGPPHRDLRQEGEAAAAPSS